MPITSAMPSRCRRTGGSIFRGFRKVTGLRSPRISLPHSSRGASSIPHMAAQLDPLGIPRATPPELDLEFYGLTDADMERRFACEAMCGGGTLPLREILDRLRNTYCRTIGVQFMHIDDSFVRHWLQERME